MRTPSAQTLDDVGAREIFQELEEVPSTMVGGFDVHRQQITFDYVDDDGVVRIPAGIGQLACFRDCSHLSRIGHHGQRPLAQRDQLGDNTARCLSRSSGKLPTKHGATGMNIIGT
jgi:hypothetical protein